MTFASETVRILYHQLPTATQVMYEEWENRLAAKRCSLHVDAVMQYDRVSEVMIRITENYSFTPVRTVPRTGT